MNVRNVHIASGFIGVLLLVALGMSLYRLSQRSKKESGPVPSRIMLLNLAVLLAFSGAVGATMYFLHGVLQLPKAYWVVPVFGALGGLVGCLLRSRGQIPLVTFDRFQPSLRLGFIGDMLLGLGGASATVFLFENTLRFDPNQTSSYPLLISVCTVAGIFGELVIEVAGDKLIASQALRVAEDAKAESDELRKAQAASLEVASNYKCDKGKFAEALKAAEQALKLAPNDAGAAIAKSRALKRLDRVGDALKVTDEALLNASSLDASDRGTLLYNRVCYRLLMQSISNEQAVADLEQSFVLRPALVERRALTEISSHY